MTYVVSFSSLVHSVVSRRITRKNTNTHIHRTPTLTKHWIPNTQRRNVRANLANRPTLCDPTGHVSRLPLLLLLLLLQQNFLSQNSTHKPTQIHAFQWRCRRTLFVLPNPPKIKNTLWYLSLQGIEQTNTQLYNKNYNSSRENSSTQIKENNTIQQEAKQMQTKWE